MIDEKSDSHGAPDSPTGTPDALGAARAHGRRGFLRTTGGMVLGSLLPACAVTDEITGKLRVQITELPAGLPSAGSVTITGGTLVAPIVAALPSATSGELDVPIGVYSVNYVPPTGYAIAPGGTNAVEVVIAVDEVSQLSFSVVAAVGTLRIFVQGLAVGAEDGGSALVTRLDIPAQLPFEVLIPATGPAERSVASGTYRIAFAAPDAHRVVAGQINPREVVVTTSPAASTTFIVEAAAAPTGIIFHSDWSSALGTTAAAFRDASKAKPWGFHCCSAATNCSIDTASSLGLVQWPTANVYRVGTLAAFPSQIATHQLEVDIGAPSSGSHRYFRYYLQVAHDDIHGNGTEGSVEHGFETAESGGGDGMNLMRIPRSNGTWFPAYREISSGIRYVAPGLNLLKDTTYRIELHLAYGPTTYTVEIRIYDALGAPAGTEADFYQLLPVNNTNLRLGGFAFNYSPQHHRFLRIGTNGPSSNFPMNQLADQDLFLHGALAVSDSDWCGPYANGI